MQDVTIRALTADDATPAWERAYSALQTAGLAYGWEMPDLDDSIRDRGRRRILHTLRHDPGGCFVADRGGDIVGVGLATVRGPLWFLSLLTVSTQVQAQGIGRRLLDATLQTKGEAGAICASDDPKALRRYRGAGFDLVPCYEAKGVLDRSLLPTVTGVTSGSYDDHRDFIEDVARLQRGAPHGPDLDFFATLERPLFVTDTPAGQGYVVCTESGIGLLAATTVSAAQALLWTALAETSDPAIDLSWVRHDQQWAIDVALAARLSLRPSGTFCVDGQVGPMSPYIPSGALG